MQALLTKKLKIITLKERLSDVKNSENALSGACQLQVSYFINAIF